VSEVSEFAHSIRRTLRLLVIATVVLFIGLGSGAYVQYRYTQQTRHALCALRADKEQQAAASTLFLTTHPKGIPGVIPAAAIKLGVENDQRTIVALGGLSC
jgi:hypothetical protein